MVIQVYTKSYTCHLVKYQHLLSSCISGCFNHASPASECYIFRLFSLSCILEDTRIQTEIQTSQTDTSEIDGYSICKLIYTLTTIRSHYLYISCLFLSKNRLPTFQHIV